MKKGIKKRRSLYTNGGTHGRYRAALSPGTDYLVVVSMFLNPHFLPSMALFRFDFSDSVLYIYNRARFVLYLVKVKRLIGCDWWAGFA